MKRRELFKASVGLGLTGWAAQTKAWGQMSEKPVVISTWNFGVSANAAAWNILDKKGAALDAVEQGVMVVESDPEEMSVGYGGRPDREGKVTLDACIMNGPTGKCGSVAFLQDIENPIRVARMVMEKTPHAMLVGAGARQFALEQGLEKKDLLTAKAKAAYEKWLENSEYKPVINIENHDTIGMLALDSNGDLAGACTTSGAAWKMHGRVGDSPLIGAGLFVDNEVGAACATGLGEAVIRVAGSAMVVEAMRQGMDPEDACRSIVERIVRKEEASKDLQVGFLALSKDGKAGAYCIHKGFNYGHRTNEKDQLVDSPSHY
ncbi:MAG: N(4)-(beta-N-acetylglucosaminyl)-L-asparaginase [Bacteroidota bacterium]